MNALAKTAIAALTIVSVAGSARAAAKDEDAIKARVAAFIELFNKGDAKAMAAFWTEDGTIVNPAGVSGTGRAEIEKIIATDSSTILKGTKMTMTVTRIRMVGKDAAWMELEHGVEGATGPDGKPMPPLTFHVPCLMVKKGKEWMIAEARPYAYLPPPPDKVATGKPEKK
jgi:uncharacterized protein (TIGR02246 family)